MKKRVNFYVDMANRLCEYRKDDNHSMINNH